jgi:hypothetical protein
VNEYKETITKEFMDNELVRKKVDDDMCARCRRPLLRGHRVQMAYILLDPHAHNPDNITQRGLQLGTDCEFVHVDCRDPFLSGKMASEYSK